MPTAANAASCASRKAAAKKKHAQKNTPKHVGPGWNQNAPPPSRFDDARRLAAPLVPAATSALPPPSALCHAAAAGVYAYQCPEVDSFFRRGFPPPPAPPSLLESIKPHHRRFADPCAAPAAPHLRGSLAFSQSCGCLLSTLVTCWRRKHRHCYVVYPQVIFKHILEACNRWSEWMARFNSRFYGVSFVG
nr:uncharacterized protein LOC127309082 [Lolium perenne]